MSQEFEYLHRKTRCEILIGGDNISNDAITLGTRFSMFVYVRAHFRFAPWRKYDSSVDGEPQENWGVEFKFQRRCCKLSFLFPSRHHTAQENLLAGYFNSLRSLFVFTFYWRRDRHFAWSSESRKGLAICSPEQRQYPYFSVTLRIRSLE